MPRDKQMGGRRKGTNLDAMVVSLRWKFDLSSGNVFGWGN
jgi:hypothetical protein